MFKNIVFNLILCFFFKEKFFDLNYILIEFKYLFENIYNIQNVKFDWLRYVIYRVIIGYLKWIFYYVVQYILLRKLYCMQYNVI